MNRKTILLLAAAAFAAAPLAKGQTYTCSGLYPLAWTGNISNLAVSAGQAVGRGNVVGTGEAALLWTAAGAVNLTPTNLPGFSGTAAEPFTVATATNGTQQVGWGLSETVNQDALLWTGTAASAVDLNPYFLDPNSTSVALGIGGNQQVGLAIYAQNNPGNNAHAVLWNGTAASMVDLNPTILGEEDDTESCAIATDGTHQVGYGDGDLTINSESGFTDSHALLWTGTAASAVDLNPTNLNFTSSAAFGVVGTQQVGCGWVGDTTIYPGTNSMGTNGSGSHALLWNGTAASAVDLTPTNLAVKTLDSAAVGTNGTEQVGWGYASVKVNKRVSDYYYALLWNGTAASAVDLNTLLPSTDTWTNAAAYSIDSFGNVYGAAVDTSGTVFAIEWSPSAPPVTQPTTQSGTVPSGSNQTVTVPSASASGTVQATFSDTAGGTLSVTSGIDAVSDLSNSNNSYNAGPVDFELPADGSVVQIWDLDYSDSSFTGPVTLVFDFDPAGMTTAQEEALQVYHYTDGQWVDIGGVVDLNADTITVETDSFSPFALGVVPEPGSLSLLSLASGAMLMRRRRKQLV
jgi:hypothetical protein